MQEMPGLLSDLEPTVACLIDRHMSSTKEWFPHELVPYDRARPFEKGKPWTCSDADLGGAELTDNVRSALFVNLLTEDNLPFYFRDVEAMFGRDSAWGEWGRRWTAEEGRHAIVIRDYLTVTRAIDPVALERGRMAQVSGGDSPTPDSPVHGMVYVTLQELATRVAHRNTGKLIGDPVGYEVMARVAADENLHHLFYRDLTTKAIELDPSAVMIAAEQVVRTFAMPGTGIVDFDKHSARIADAGIYDLQLHYEQVLVPVLYRNWAIDKLTGLSDAAEQARDSLLSYVDRLGRLAKKLSARRERHLLVPTA